MGLGAIKLESEPPPLWLIIFTIAIYMGFLVAYSDELPQVSLSDCSDNPGVLYVNCVSAWFGFIGLLFNVLTLGGVDSPLPVLYVQGPLVLFFALTWGIIIFKSIQNSVEAIVP